MSFKQLFKVEWDHSHLVLKDGMTSIRLSLKTFVDSTCDILSSFMDEVQTKLTGKGPSDEHVKW